MVACSSLSAITDVVLMKKDLSSPFMAAEPEGVEATPGGWACRLFLACGEHPGTTAT